MTKNDIILIAKGSGFHAEFPEDVMDMIGGVFVNGVDITENLRQFAEIVVQYKYTSKN